MAARGLYYKPDDFSHLPVADCAQTLAQPLSCMGIHIRENGGLYQQDISAYLNATRTLLPDVLLELGIGSPDHSFLDDCLRRLVIYDIGVIGFSQTFQSLIGSYLPDHRQPVIDILLKSGVSHRVANFEFIHQALKSSTPDGSVPACRDFRIDDHNTAIFLPDINEPSCQQMGSILSALSQGQRSIDSPYGKCEIPVIPEIIPQVLQSLHYTFITSTLKYPFASISPSDKSRYLCLPCKGPWIDEDGLTQFFFDVLFQLAHETRHFLDYDIVGIKHPLTYTLMELRATLAELNLKKLYASVTEEDYQQAYDTNPFLHILLDRPDQHQSHVFWPDTHISDFYYQIIFDLFQKLGEQQAQQIANIILSPNTK